MNNFLSYIYKKAKKLAMYIKGNGGPFKKYPEVLVR
jgi:hypothetical protein